jgi:hypothetical protein
MPGPKRQPRHLRLLRGTLQPCRDLESTGLPPVGEVPSAPTWMTNLDARKEWDRLARVMVANKLLSAGNASLLAHAVMLGARLSEAWKSGATPSAAQVTVYRRLLGDLGLTNMADVAPRAGPNRFLDFKRR